MAKTPKPKGSIAESVIKIELKQIAEQLSVVATAPRINVLHVGDLMARLALVYGQCVEADRRGRL